MRNWNLLRCFAVPIVHVASADASARLELLHASLDRARRPAEPPALRPSTETRHLSDNSGFVLSDGCSPGEIGFEDRRARRIAWRRCEPRLHPTFSAFLSISLARRYQAGPDAIRVTRNPCTSRYWGHEVQSCRERRHLCDRQRRSQLPSRRSGRQLFSAAECDYPADDDFQHRSVEFLRRSPPTSCLPRWGRGGPDSRPSI
jgi:hypothetical protein